MRARGHRRCPRCGRLARRVRRLEESMARLQAVQREALTDLPLTDRGPVIHISTEDGKDFYGIVKAMDADSFSVVLANSEGRVIVVPKSRIVYYRMKY